MPRAREEARYRHPRHERRGEARLPGVAATLVAIALYLLLPQGLLIAPRYVLPALEGVLHGLRRVCQRLFRGEFYEWLGDRRDELFELSDPCCVRTGR